MKTEEYIAASKCYEEITQLPLRLFIQANVTGNLNVLIITGNPTEEDLQAAWQKICSQYCSAIGDQEYLHCLIVYNETAHLAAAYQSIQMTIPVMIKACEHRIFYEPLFDELNKVLRTSYKLSANDADLNIQYLKKMERRSKGLKLQLDLKLIELEQIKTKDEIKKPTEQYYESILVSLSNHAGYLITDQISTFQFCERIRRLNLYIKDLNTKTYGRK